MEALNKTVLLEFNSNNINTIRKTHRLDQPGTVEKAVASLDQWVRDQQHFGKKDFPKQYLEAILIASKGDTEKAKAKIETLFSLRTEWPTYFGDFDIREDFKELDGVLYSVILPKLSKDQGRIIFTKMAGDYFMPNAVIQFTRLFVMYLEYLRLNDKNDGFVLISDMTELSLMALIRRLKLEDVRRGARLIIGIYGTRFKGIHIISPSRFLSIIVWILKQVMPAKLGNRIHTHQSIKTVHNFVDADLLPLDYGGKENYLQVLFERNQQELGSEQFRAFQRDMSKAVISKHSNSSSTTDVDSNGSGCQDHSEK